MVERRIWRVGIFRKALWIGVAMILTVAPQAALAQASATQGAAPAQGGSAPAGVPSTAAATANKQAPAMTPVFDVASIKPNKSGTGMVMIRPTQNGFSASNVSLLMVIRTAYGVQDFQISGAPAWINSDRYDIEAKVDEATANQMQKLDTTQRYLVTQQMLQTLLADRCKLTLHHETKELPEYALVIAKNGPKLHEANPDDTYPNGFNGPDGHSGAGMMRMSPGLLTAQGVSLKSLVTTLSQQLRATVVDKTGLTGKYDFTLQWTPDMSQPSMTAGSVPQGPGAPPPPDASGPSLLTALEEQLGLKLESQKGPLDIIVIDHVEEPSEN